MINRCGIDLIGYKASSLCSLLNLERQSPGSFQNTVSAREKIGLVENYF